MSASDSAPPTPLPLAAEDLRAIDALTRANRETLRQAVERMPTYQRVTLRWVARELAAMDSVPPAAPLSLPKLMADAVQTIDEAHRAQRDHRWRMAEASKNTLEHAIRTSAATDAEKAFLAVRVAHLWERVSEARGA